MREFRSEETALDNLRIALLHLQPSPGDIARNAQAAEIGIETAAAMGAQFAVTPELCLTGYNFTPAIGADWIAPADDDVWIARFRAQAARANIHLFFAHPERDPATGRCHNSVFAIGADGSILGRHRKIHTLPGAEGWSAKGETAAPIAIAGLRAGLLVCADAYAPGPAARLAAAGADILISSANWAPFPHGPEDCWERRSLETGLPLFVCNRTGMDRTLDFTAAESTLVHRGERLLTFQAGHPAIVVIDWDRRGNTILRHNVRRLVWEDAPA